MFKWIKYTGWNYGWCKNKDKLKQCAFDNERISLYQWIKIKWYKRESDKMCDLLNTALDRQPSYETALTKRLAEESRVAREKHWQQLKSIHELFARADEMTNSHQDTNPQSH
jgi:hypothetical protein